MISPFYDKPDVLKQIKNVLKTEGIVQLQQILLPSEFLKYKQVLAGLDFYHDYCPHLHSQQTPLVQHSEFRKLAKLEIIESLIGKKTLKSVRLIGFRHKDYLLISDQSHKKQSHVILDFTEEWDQSFGGYHVYKEQDGNAIMPAIGANILTVVNVPADMHFFVQYANHYAEHHQRDLVWMIFE